MAGRDPAQDIAPEMLNSPAFQQAVAAAVEAQVGKIAQQLAAARNAASSQGNDSDPDFVNRLALAIAGLTDQGSGRKRVDPAIVAKRDAAAAKLAALLIDLRARGEMPEWRLKNKVQMVIAGQGETVLEPFTIGSDHRPQPVEIAWPGVPNHAMAPLNDAAELVFALYCESTGSIPRDVPMADDLPVAITPRGVVVRGTAAASIIRRDAGRAGDAPMVGGDPGTTHMPHAAAVIRRDGPSHVVETRILGSLAEPARQTA